MQRKRRIWRVISYLGFGVAVIGLAGVFNYSITYGNHNPTVADASSGRIHPYNYHGRIVYLNDDELLRVRAAEAGLFIGGAVFAVAGSLGGLFRRD